MSEYQEMTDFKLAYNPHPGMSDATLMNNIYQVDVRFIGDGKPFGRVVHLSIKRRDKEIIRDWRDLQWIKNQIIGEEYEAIEIFPKESNLTDTANQYHLWAFLDFSFPFGFRGRNVLEGLPMKLKSGNPKQRPFASYVRPSDADMEMTAERFRQEVEKFRQEGIDL